MTISHGQQMGTSYLSQQNIDALGQNAVVSNLNHALINCAADDAKEKSKEDSSTVGSYEDDEMQAQIDAMLCQLSEEELELAARASNMYFQRQVHDDMSDSSLLSSDRTYYAQQMAQRYLKSKKTVDKAVHCMKSTLAFRKRVDVDGLRQTFDDDHDGSPYRVPLEKMLSWKKNYVLGYDKDGRSTFHFTPTEHTDPEWTLKEFIYTMERALASSKSSDGTVNAVMNFSKFSVTRHSPPLAIGKDFMLTLRNHYVGCLNKVFILDAPRGFGILWNLFSPFVGTSTRKKIVFLSGTKKVKLSEWYDPSQATSFMSANGQKTRELNVSEYLYETPFDQAFDEVQQNRRRH